LNYLLLVAAVKFENLFRMFSILLTVCSTVKLRATPVYIFHFNLVHTLL